MLRSRPSCATPCARAGRWWSSARDDPHHAQRAVGRCRAPPQFDLIEDDVDVVMGEIQRAREASAARLRGGASATTAGSGARPRRWPSSSHGRTVEPGFAVQRQEKADRQIRYTLHAYAADAPSGHRYGARGAGDRQRRTPGVGMVVADAPRRRRPRGRARADRCRAGRAGAGARRASARSRRCSSIDRLRREHGLARGRARRCRIGFAGSSARGRRTVALRMAEILRRLGFVERPKVVSVTRDDLVGQYVGHTAPEDASRCSSAPAAEMLFIDEAYYLYRPENERDYGQEAIEILLQVMEAERDDLVVVLAGYTRPHGDVLPLQPGHGLARRAPHRTSRLRHPRAARQIADLMLEQQGYEFTPAAREAFGDVRRAPRPSRRASRTGAASATPSSARGCARPAGSASAATRWTATTW